MPVFRATQLFDLVVQTIHRIGEPQQFRLHDSGLRRVQTRAEGGTVERVRRVDDVLVAVV